MVVVKPLKYVFPARAKKMTLGNPNVFYVKNKR